MEVLVGLQFDLLSETDNVIATENVCLVNFLKDKHIPGDWCLLNLGCGQLIALIDVILFGACVTNKVFSDLLVLKHDGITNSQ